MKINAINLTKNNVQTGKLATNRSYFVSNDKFEITFNGSSSRKITEKLKDKIEQFARTQYEKSLPQNLTDKKIERTIAPHGTDYLESLKTREERELFLTYMMSDFEGKPLNGASKTLSAYEANLLITKNITDIQTYINLVNSDENWKPLSGLSRVLGRVEAAELMEAGITDYEKYFNLVDKDENRKPKSGYSRILTTQEAIKVISNDIEDVETFIREQDKK